MGRNLLAICVVLLSARCVSASIIVVGGPANVSNTLPFGVSYANEYQQVYMSSDFSGLGTIGITGLTFYTTLVAGSTTAINSGNWTISLSTTSAAWNTLSGTPALNIGSDNTTIFSGSLAQPWGREKKTLEILFTQPFSYDPTRGNLLMDVWASNVAAPNGGSLSFDANWPDQTMGRVFYSSFGGGGYYVNHGTGLVTGFTYGAASPTGVPEPASVVLAGFAVLALATVVTVFPNRCT